MVTTATSFGRNGVADWIIQRFTALVLASYTLFWVAFFFITPEINYTVWQELFSQLWMRIFTLLALLSIAAHGWIGLWGVVTDYLTTRMMGSTGLVLRMLVLGIYAIVTIAYLVWGIEILWGAK